MYLIQTKDSIQHFNNVLIPYSLSLTLLDTGITECESVLFESIFDSIVLLCTVEVALAT